MLRTHNKSHYKKLLTSPKKVIQNSLQKVTDFITKKNYKIHYKKLQPSSQKKCYKIHYKKLQTSSKKMLQKSLQKVIDFI